MIPKIIHYCWLSDDPIPESLQKCMNSWKEKIPEYEFKKWDFTIFPKSESKWVEEAFDNKKYSICIAIKWLMPPKMKKSLYLLQLQLPQSMWLLMLC